MFNLYHTHKLIRVNCERGEACVGIGSGGTISAVAAWSKCLGTSACTLPEGGSDWLVLHVCSQIIYAVNGCHRSSKKVESQCQVMDGSADI